MAGDPLQRYRSKRDFRVTAEPAGRRGTSGEALSFVVQKHAARRLHYDFRLELDGTLKSWAVPKGPSLDPAVKRMAVHVEDHPLGYGSFEGVIPPKQYGAGTVIVWDRGEWVPIGDARAGHAAGKLKFELHGEKLRGAWTLVRMRGRGDERQEPWLLIKERDDEARPAAAFDVVEALPDSVLGGAAAKKTPAKKAPAKKAPAKKARKPPASTAMPLPEGAEPAALPLALSPQLATLVDAMPATGDWIWEVKFDGYRLLARIDGADVRLFTRNGHDWSAKMKGLVAALRALGLPPCWLDGEIVVQGERGTPDFQRLQNAFEASRTEDIQYFFFDLPFADGHDLRAVPLRERRALLRRLLDAAPAGGPLHFSEDFAASAADLLHTACALRLEGIIGKRADSAYGSRRSTAWIKLKCTKRQEFVIGGYTDPKGSRAGLGSLLLGIHDANGRLRYAGNVGTGFDRKTLASLAAKLAPLRSGRTPFFELPRDVRGHWVRPKLVAEVSFGEWTTDGRIRHSVFHALRSDKPPEAITKEVPKPVAAAAPAAKKRGAKVGPATTAAAVPAGLRITHPGRVIDARSGFTKLDLVQYYARAAPAMLPHLAGRPVSLVRGPQGVGGELFFQKHAERLRMPGVVQLDPALDADHEPLLEVDSLDGLLGAAQMNVIEFHTWNATTKAIEKPDRLTFDLDPGEGLAWPRMIEAAQLVKALLDELGLASFLKTSGGKGLHVVVPVTPRLGWDVVKDFSQAVVQHLAATLPDRFVAKSGPKNRVGKIFPDYLRNGRGATTVAAWSVRARPGLGVSVPLAWHELEGLRGAAQWTMANVDERLERPDPWAAYAKTRQALGGAMKALGFEPAAA